jgi:hypothetical protein
LTVRLLALYPHSWHDRYGEELAELLTAEPVTPAAILHVLAGALDAHLHRKLVAGDTGSGSAMLRAAMITSLCAVVGFAVAALAFVEAVDDLAYAPLMQAHPQLRGTWNVLIVGGLVALGAVIVGGLPILIAVSRDAWARRRRDLRHFLVPPLVVAVLIACDIVEDVRRAHHVILPQPFGPMLDATFHLLFVAGAIMSTTAVCTPVLRSTIPIRYYRFALVPAAVAALAMGAAGGATLLWLVQAHNMVPMRLGLSAAGIGFASIVLVMVASAALAVSAIHRALLTSGSGEQPA